MELTEKERAELEELRARKSASTPTSGLSPEEAAELKDLRARKTSKDPKMGFWEALGRTASQVGSFGFADEAQPHVERTLANLPEWMGGMSDQEYKDAYDNSSPKAETEEVRRMAKKAMADRPGASMAGAVLGGGISTAPLMALAPAITSARTALAVGALGGTEAGLLALGESEEEEFGGRVKDALKGAGIGAGLSFLFPAAGKVAKIGTSALKNTSKGAMKMSNRLARRALGFERGSINKLRGGAKRADEIGGILRDEGMFNKGMGLEAMKESIEDIQKRTRETISNIYNDKALKNNTATTGEVFIDKVEGEVGKRFRGKQLRAAEETQLDKAIEDVMKYADDQGNISFLNLWKAKQDIGDFAFGRGATLENREAAKDTWRVLSDVLDDSIEQFKDKETKEALKYANKLYNATREGMDVLNVKINRQAGNKSIGLTDVIATGAGGTIGSTLGPAGAAAGSMAVLGAKRLAEQRGPQVGTQVMKKAAKALDAKKVSQALNLPEKALNSKYGRVLLKTAERGELPLASTHYILMQRDPDYKRFVEESQKDDSDGE